MSAPLWMTEGASEVRRAQIERDWSNRQRIPTIPQVSAPVDISDATEFPEIAAAIQWARLNRAIDERRGGR